MATLNYRHLRYFWMIAHENNLTRAAERLHVSQSALSIQLRKLEESLGQSLFERDGKRLILTEAGRMVLDYANAIFRAGDELLSLMHNRRSLARQVLRVGAVATLSRNFQAELLRPLLARSDVELVLRSGNLRELLAQMHNHTLDLVLSNHSVPRDADSSWQCHLLAEQSVSLIGRPLDDRAFEFPDDLARYALLLPSVESEVRAAFDFLMDQAGLRPTVIAEVDDMAMLRLLCRDSGNLTLVPPVVVRDELAAGLLVEHYRLPDLKERFYAITPSRQFPNALVRDLLGNTLGTATG